MLYTDVWVSMGKEAEAAERLKILASYQIHDRLLKVAKPGALVMHCLPAYRGKEITGAVFEAHQQTIFDQAENRCTCRRRSWFSSAPVISMPTRVQRSVRATKLGMATNVVLAGVKFAAGVLGNSYALIADAIESFADIASSIIVWRGVVIAAKPADDDHPYGHGRAETLAAAVVAVMLLGAALVILVQSVNEIRAPHHMPGKFTLYVLLGVVFVKESLYRMVGRSATKWRASW